MEKGESELEPHRLIKAVKNLRDNEIQCLSVCLLLAFRVANSFIIWHCSMHRKSLRTDDDLTHKRQQHPKSSGPP